MSEDYLDAKLSCSRWEDFVGARNAVSRNLPPDVRYQFGRVFSFYLQQYSLDGAYDRLNNRTVREIVGEFGKIARPAPLETGEVDGVRYELYERPDEMQDEC